MVFHNHPIASSTALPRYMDLGWYDEHQGIAFTHSSNLVQALDAAVRQPDWPAKMAAVAAVSARLRRRLTELGFHLIAQDPDATPGVVTIALPPGQSSAHLGQQLQQAGFLLSYNSDYIRQRNWIQICLMGEYCPEKLEALTSWLVANAKPTAKSAPATAPARAAVAS
jgi:aspartate aminotransferase-like enzyme